ncbi:MAG: ankyrin repeat domain-containing protein [Gammaproteobacteria bacterium]|nr:ankyrin repeat domain-containing protein [Gammaproteobacteria bacterium]MCY4198256.1 ankyrin repeat domain-containing protein [Gammaproteobacteria bacterium]MCY4276323.1 ankyrin repeat domain-containing protein [Gammaproteobacteria bacterium]MCY4323843.1 ankyrin repeat domain-containing protein [Gammaproteobacteria bacterium]
MKALISCVAIVVLLTGCGQSAETAKSKDSIRALIEAGADMNARNDNGQTPLQVAAANEHASIVRELCAISGIEDEDGICD